MISFLTPTRGRAESLKKGIDSLGLVDGESEALVWLDTDDPQYDRYIAIFENYPNVKLFIKDRIGYSNFHVMMNFLAEQASYDWMILWNDDAWMGNPQWYSIFKNSVSTLQPAEEPLVINIWGQGHKINLFPIISRKYWEILGHFSQVAGCDDYTRIVSMEANIVHHIKGIRPEHRNRHGADPLIDETYLEIAEQRKTLQDTWDPSKGANVEKLQEDIDKLKRYIELNSPEISFLVPSRDRAEHLKESLDSLELEDNNLEALVWLDEDEPQIEEYHNLFDGNRRVKIFIKPRVGYANFHVMLNFLASEANGKWLFLWNDDSYMGDPNWFKIFNENTSQVDPTKQPFVFDIYIPRINRGQFPVMSKKYYEVLGHLSEVPLCDLYIRRVADKAQIYKNIHGIDLRHRQGNLDPDKDNIEDKVKQERDAHFVNSKYLGSISPAAYRKRDIDVEKLLEYLNKTGQNISSINPVISILVPTRARAEHLNFSLGTLGLDENNLEALVWIDEDDPQLEEYQKLLGNNQRIKIFIKPRIGYAKFHDMMNFLAKESKGDWLFLWNDDSYMDGPEWYKTFKEYTDLIDPVEEVVVLNIWGQGTKSNSFPIVSRKYYQLLEHWAPIAHTNLHIEKVANYTKIQRSIFGIQPHHRNYGRDKKMGDLMDDTKKEVDDLKSKNKWMGLHTPSGRRKRNVDVIKILGQAKKKHAGFIGLGRLGLPIALAMEARGNRLIAYDADLRVKQSIENKTSLREEEDLRGMLTTTFIQPAASIQEVVQETDLVFCAVPPSSLRDVAMEISKAADKFNKKINFVVIKSCEPGSYERDVKPLLSSKVNYIYSPYLVNRGTVINDFYNAESVVVANDNNDVQPILDYYKLTIGNQKARLSGIAAAEQSVGVAVTAPLSFLIPSRGRPEILKQSLDSLGLFTHHLEALVWLDNDDPKLEEYQKAFADNKRVKLFVNKRVTYKNFHLMVNFLASQSSGDWLFLWHDDAYMGQHDWFNTFYEYASLIDPRAEPVVFNHNTISSANAYFPIISRKYYEILGYIAPTAFSGWYVARLSANHRFQRPIYDLPIRHRDGNPENNPEAVNDETKQEIEALKKKSRYLGFLSGGVSQRRNDDGVKINQARDKYDVGFIGLGKLGLPVALAMEARGNKIVGYDINPAVKDYLSKFEVPFMEKDIETVLPWNRVELAETIKDLVGKTDLIFCAIQTPHDTRFEGHVPLTEERADFDYSHLKTAVSEVSRAADELGKRINLVVISTCLPGTYRTEIKPLLSPNINYVYNPFFIAMGTVLDDFINPEFILIGKDEGDITPLADFYKLTLGPAKQFVTDITTAEGIKVFYNTFITTKTVLGNMYGEFAHKLGMNVDHIYEAIALASDRLMSPRYLKAGVGDGGGCHPRDNIALSHLAKAHNLSYNFFDHLMMAREKHMEWLGSLFKKEIEDTGLPGIILGKSFKPESNILTGSPAILVANMLKDKGLKFDHYEFDLPEKLSKAVYLVATAHKKFGELTFPNGSVVIDPFRIVPKQDGVELISIGAGV